MQGLGYVVIRMKGNKSSRKVYVLAREGKERRYFKIRRPGQDGIHFTDEEIHLNTLEGRDDLRRLEMGQTIIL